MKRILELIILTVIMISPAYSADDDSTPYMPYTEQPKQEQPKTSAPKKTTKKAPVKKKTTQAKKKPAPKKTAKRPAPKRQSSLQQAIALLEQDRYEAARPYLIRAIQENRNDPNVWYWYGVYHEKIGSFYQAQYFYSKAVKIDPAFEPLSRVVFYPDDPTKTPLWDPKRPARVYPVETASRGITRVPPNARDRASFPSAPNDPQLPGVPVYIPPEPGTSPLDGDSWSPGVYVPPAQDEIQTEGYQTPVYIPPEPEGIIADNSTTYRQVLEIPAQNEERYRQRLYINTQPEAQDVDTIIRADKPLYNPPEPGQKVTPPPSQNPPKQSAPKATVKEKETPPRRSASVPNNRVVRQNQKKKPQTSSRQTQNTKRTTSPDVRPRTQTQPARPSQPQRTQPERQPSRPVQPAQPVRPERTQPERRQTEYLPPVGQFSPDPGTISENPAPPVGQGNSY